MPNLRIFSKDGIHNYSKFLDELREQPTLNLPSELLTDDSLSQQVEPIIPIENQILKNRLEAGKFFAEKLKEIEDLPLSLNMGLWSWLDLLFFDQTCPVDDMGNRFIGETYRHIPSENYRHYYRHLLLGPWQVFKQHAEKGRLLLAGAVDKPGDYNEQIASRQEIVTSSGLMKALDLLYFSEDTGLPKRGAATSGKVGGLRRFIAIMQQLDLTYDLQSMTENELIDLLPKEFNKWKSKSI
jgi:hypothetical protein